MTLDGRSMDTNRLTWCDLGALVAEDAGRAEGKAPPELVVKHIVAGLRQLPQRHQHTWAGWYRHTSWAMKVCISQNIQHARGRHFRPHIS